MSKEFKKYYVNKIAQETALGKSDSQIIKDWGIARSTFYEWKKNHPEFLEAYDLGKGLAESNHIELGRLAMTKQLDLDYQFWRDIGKHLYKINNQPTAGGTNNTQINIDNMNVLQNQSNEELLSYIKNKLEENPELQHIIEHNE